MNRYSNIFVCAKAAWNKVLTLTPSKPTAIFCFCFFVVERKAMNQRASNLLDEALGLVDDGSKAWPLSGRVVLVEDSVETSGAFVLHHLVKRALSPHSSNVVVFLALSQPFSHYDRVLRKLVRTYFPSLSQLLFALREANHEAPIV